MLASLRIKLTFREAVALCAGVGLLALNGCGLLIDRIHSIRHPISDGARVVLARNSINMMNDGKPKKPSELLPELAEAHRREPTWDSSYVLSELALQAAVGPKRNGLVMANREEFHQFISNFIPTDVHELYFNAALWSLECLTDRRYDSSRNVHDERFAKAARRYNDALYQFFQLAIFNERTSVDEHQQLSISIGKATFLGSIVDRTGLPYPMTFQLYAPDMQPAMDQGLGVPIQANVKRNGNVIAMQMTAIMNVDAARKESGSYGEVVPFSIEVRNPMDDDVIEINGYPVQLVASYDNGDLADVLAMGWRPRAEEVNPNAEAKLSLHASEQTFDPAKIPVVLVHSLVNTRDDWDHAIARLRADPVIEKRFQFWTFEYNTADSTAKIAFQLQSAIAARRRFPDSSAWDRCVLIGHGMGGLAAQLQSVAVLSATANKTESSYRIDDEAAPPQIGSLITIATPFQGWSIDFEKAMVRAGLNQQEPDLRNGDFPSQLHASSMRPNARLLSRIHDIASNHNGVRHHNIVGRMQGHIAESVFGDGAVDLQSARFRGQLGSDEIEVDAHHRAIIHHDRTISKIRDVLLLEIRSDRDLDVIKTPRQTRTFDDVQSGAVNG